MPKQPPKTPFDSRKGFIAGYKITNPQIGGYVVVWDTATAGTNLPLPEYQEPFAVRHHDGKLASPGALPFQNKAAAKKAAGDLAEGSHAIPLQKLGSNSGETLPTDAADGEEIPIAKPAEPRARDPLPPSQTQVSTDPEQAHEVVVLRPEEVSTAVHNTLSGIPLSAIRQTLEEALNATKPIFEKGNSFPKQVPDHQTRLAATKLILEYYDGKPLERRVVETKQCIDASVFRDRIKHSTFYREELRKILDEIDAELAILK